MDDVRYRQISTYGSGGTTIEYVEATFGLGGLYHFDGRGDTAAGAKQDLCRRMRAEIAWVQKALDAIEATPPGAVEPVADD